MNRTVLFRINAGRIACGAILTGTAASVFPALFQHVLFASKNTRHVNRLWRMISFSHKPSIPLLLALFELDGLLYSVTSANVNGVVLPNHRVFHLTAPIGLFAALARWTKPLCPARG